MQKITIQTHGRPVKKPLTETLTFDDKELIITGRPAAVSRMKRWILRAWRKEDYKEILRPFLKETKPGEPIYFPLIDPGGWYISIVSSLKSVAHRGAL